MNCLGLDIGGTSVKAAVLVRGRCVRVARSGEYARPSMNVLQTAIAGVTERAGDVDAVGVCLPGVYDASRRRLTHCVNIPALEGVPLDALLRQTAKLPKGARVHVCSDALAAAFDISHSRRISGRLLVLSLGTGVGCGVLDGDVPLDVDHGSPGHLGQMDVSLPGEAVTGPDGGAGGLEGYLGLAALQRRHPGKDVATALADYTGEEPAVRALVRALRIAHAIYRPQHICLCGGLGLALAHLLPTIRRQTDHRLTALARRGWTLTVGKDVFHAARGAARWASRQGAP